MAPPLTSKNTNSTPVETSTENNQNNPECSTNTCWNLRVSAEADRGGRKYMEDVALVDFRREQNIEYAVFGVFDGHGGKQAARFAKAHLMNFIRQQKSFWSSRPENVKRAIHAGFIACHEAMRRKLPDWPKTVLGHPCTAGTTASIAIIRGNKLYVAYVGDSGIVMGYEKVAEPSTENTENVYKSYNTYGSTNIQFGVSTFSEQKQSGPAYSSTSSMKPKTNYYYRELTTDHKPESLTEKRRIETAGGAVAIKNGVNRVIWNRPRIHAAFNRHECDRIPFLAVARSLGDLWSYNPTNNEFIVSPIPDIDVIDLTKAGEKARFIIVASDGVWNMIRPWDAVHLVATFNERKEQGKTDGSPAHDIVREALTRWRLRGLRADNTSAVVVWLDRASGAGQPDFVNRAWSSDSPAQDMANSGGPGERALQESESRNLEQSEQLDDDDDDMSDISLDREGGDMVPANYPSQNRMRKFADLSIPHNMLTLMSDDEEEDETTEPSSSTHQPTTSTSLDSPAEEPVQDSEVSSTTNDESDSAATASATNTEIPAVSVTTKTRSAQNDTVVTTTTTIITRRKRTSSDLDDDSAVESMENDTMAASDEQMHTPKRKKSDASSTTSTKSEPRLLRGRAAVTGEPPAESPARRSRRLIGKQNVTRSATRRPKK